LDSRKVIEGCPKTALLGDATPTPDALRCTAMFDVRLLATITLSCILLAGCAETGDNPSAKEREAGGASATASKSPAGETTTGGTEVGEAFAEAELSPVGDSGVSGKVVFKEVGSVGVQVELDVSGLPAPEGGPEEPKPYFAQVHEGSCSEAPKGGGHEHEDDHGDDHHGHDHEHGGSGPSLALLDPGPLIAKVDEYADHAEYEAPPADALPGNIDAPLSVGASDDGTGSVTSLLEGVEPEQVTSGSPKYMDLRAPSHDAPAEDWPALACANLGEAG
jgi:hypothetical protein